MRALMLIACACACACASLNGSANRVVGMRTGERVTVTLVEGEGFPSCTKPASDDLECTFPEEFVAQLVIVGSPGSLEPLGVACDIASRNVPHTDQDVVVCAWHLLEIRNTEARAARHRSR